MACPEHGNDVAQGAGSDIDQSPQRKTGQTVEEWAEEAARWAQAQVDEGALSDLLGS
ncbi:hypothetical protein ISS85_03625 [Candidatus Microgenomates bacterium]|nr:hypothetical protein [Candidatus Microgenomates bacterium]